MAADRHSADGSAGYAKPGRLRITLITTCFNREATVADAVRSVLAQDYDDVEYLVVDGASTDRTVQVVKETLLSADGASWQTVYGPIAPEALLADGDQGQSLWRDGLLLIRPGRMMAVRLISEPDGGMYEAINKGIRMATGDVVGLVHSDDILFDSRVLSDYADRFLQTGADFVYADGIYVSAHDVGRVERRWVGGPIKPMKLWLGWLPLHTTAYIRRDVYWKYGLYDESYRIAADTDLMLRVLSKADVSVHYMAHRNTIRMRLGGLSTSLANHRQMWREDVRCYAGHVWIAAPLVKVLKMTWKVPQFVRAWLGLHWF